jgi:hypothetical protein
MRSSNDTPHKIKPNMLRHFNIVQIDAAQTAPRFFSIVTININNKSIKMKIPTNAAASPTLKMGSEFWGTNIITIRSKQSAPTSRAVAIFAKRNAFAFTP